MTKSLTIIDADSICYMCGNADTLAESIEKADSRIENIIENTKADYIAFVITSYSIHYTKLYEFKNTKLEK